MFVNGVPDLAQTNQTYLPCPVRRPRRNQQRAAAMRASVATPSARDRVPMNFTSARSCKLFKRNLEQLVRPLIPGSNVAAYAHASTVYTA